ncbi:MAG: phage head closure protein [Candidatus Accumulibacter phosphatis]|jgi:SPP1 family predicted phage head-tail adaptor|uniref:phage head closure protein n=1 Tax=Candidatus Accumulibacter sp. ACC012 TaxID=2823332 RepID=UPI0025C33A0B|nr:phage head closure protein [Candidatus Accumulibacter sp. ACC012]
MTATFNPGQAKQRIRLQAKSVTRNAIGEEVVSWSDVVTDTADHALWAEAWPLKGREFFAAQQTRYAADVRFRIRWRAGVVREQRIDRNALARPAPTIRTIRITGGFWSSARAS